MFDRWRIVQVNNLFKSLLKEIGKSEAVTSMSPVAGEVRSFLPIENEARIKCAVRPYPFTFFPALRDLPRLSDCRPHSRQSGRPPRRSNPHRYPFRRNLDEACRSRYPF